MKLTDQRIGAELSALRETPDRDFAAALDRRVAAGFPDVRQPVRKPSRNFTWGRLLPALGALAAVAVVVVVASSTGGGSGPVSSISNENRPAGSRAAGTTATPNQDAIPGGTASPDVIPAPGPLPQPTTRPHNGRSQVQERTAQLGLSTEADRLEDAAGGVIDVTDRYDGFVDSSDVHTGGSRGHASFSLRIPTQRLQDALSDLSDLGRVTLLDQGSTNVTGDYTDAGEAYAAARTKVDGLLAQLQGASTPARATAIRVRLDAAREELAAARTALRDLKQRVALTPVSVQIAAHGDGAWSIGDAADDAVNVLVAIAGALLIALAILVPLAALLVLGWLGAREFSRRRREATLDRS